MIDPAAVPIAAEFVIVDVVFVPASLIVDPPFCASAFAPITRTSFAFVALLLAAIVHLNTSSFVPVPDK